MVNLNLLFQTFINAQLSVYLIWQMDSTAKGTKKNTVIVWVVGLVEQVDPKYPMNYASGKKGVVLVVELVPNPNCN